MTKNKDELEPCKCNCPYILKTKQGILGKQCMRKPTAPNEQVIDALEFYADDNNYCKDIETYEKEIMNDHGERARQVLKTLKGGA